MRSNIILEYGTSRPFDPINRAAQVEASQGKTLNELLDAFAALRATNLDTLQNKNLTPAHLERKGKHPELGEVTLGQLIATWTTHDLNHIRQIVEVLARQRADAVGPWKVFLPILGA